MKQKNQVLIYDATLRDGAQALGITFSQSGKIRFAHLLDDFGIPFLEGGFAGSNDRDMQFFADAKKEHFSQIRIVSFGSTRRAGVKVENDPFIEALLRAQTSDVAIYGKSWKLHVKEVLRTSNSENLDMISESVAYLAKHGLAVHFDAEHFFDGYKDDPVYAKQVLKRALEAGAADVTLCDTNGGTMPWEVSAIIGDVCADLSVAFKDPIVGIHAHNDSGLAVATSLEAYRAGARMVQGCINGYGERSGNANLTTIIPNLMLKLGASVVKPARLSSLRSLSLAVDDLVNQSPDQRAPYVGEAAFSHKAGAHVSGVRRLPSTFEHIAPESVGNERHIVLSELSGASNILYRLKQAGAEGEDIGKDEVKRILATLKCREGEGYSFESADASFRILVQKALGEHKPFFELEAFRVTIEKRGGDKRCMSEATIKVRVGDKSELTAGEGCGPVEALDNALRAALSKFYPSIANVTLTDFRVRILDPKQATGATTRVLIESSDGKKRWGTVGVSPNIIEAAWQALLDSVEYKLLTDSECKPSKRRSK